MSFTMYINKVIQFNSMSWQGCRGTGGGDFLDPSPVGISNVLPKGGYGYFLELHIEQVQQRATVYLGSLSVVVRKHHYFVRCCEV